MAAADSLAQRSPPNRVPVHRNLFARRPPALRWRATTACWCCFSRTWFAPCLRRRATPPCPASPASARWGRGRGVWHWLWRSFACPLAELCLLFGRASHAPSEQQRAWVPMPDAPSPVVCWWHIVSGMLPNCSYHSHAAPAQQCRCPWPCTSTWGPACCCKSRRCWNCCCCRWRRARRRWQLPDTARVPPSCSRWVPHVAGCWPC